MAAQEEAARIDRELEEARRDLRVTLEQVNHKVENVEAKLRPDSIIRRNTLAVSCIAAALGFMAGRGDQPLRFEWLAIGALLGSAVGIAGSGNGSNNAATR